jgi:hypothetical protein
MRSSPLGRFGEITRWFEPLPMEAFGSLENGGQGGIDFCHLWELDRTPGTPVPTTWADSPRHR